jgi:hypothetical protein
MEQSGHHSGRSPQPELGDTVPLEDVRAELEAIEAMAGTIGDLTSLLRARLPPEHFRLVWALRDTIERQAIAEELLRERRLVDVLARHLPATSPAMRAVSRHIVGGELAIDETG